MSGFKAEEWPSARECRESPEQVTDLTVHKKTHSDQGPLVEDNDDIMTSSTSIVIDLEDLSAKGHLRGLLSKSTLGPLLPWSGLRFPT